MPERLWFSWWALQDLKLGAHNTRVWKDLLDDNPYALLTPNVLGRRALPAASDATRICDMTTNAFITAPPRRKRPRYTGIVEKEIREKATLSIREVLGPFGHIRLRRDAEAPPASEWTVDLFGDAIPLRLLPMAG